MKKYIKIVILIIIIILLSVIIIKIYDNEENIIIKNSKIIIKTTNKLSMLYETDDGIYEVVSYTEWPTSGYIFNEKLSGCEHGGSVTWDSLNNKVKMEGSYTDKCFVYFEKKRAVTVNDIISNYSTECSVDVDGIEGTVSGIAITNEGLCRITDGMYGGYTFYYRGAVDNNWVKFGKEKQADGTYKDIYWRIIRFNGDESIRMIYSGTTAPTKETSVVMTGEGTQIGKSVFNEYIDKAEYLGFYYTIDKPHGNEIPSTIADYLLNEETGWYYTSEISNYSDYIDETAKFCNDRRIYTGVGYGDTPVSYDFTVRERLGKFRTDCFTYDTFNISIGLITGDESIMAGSVFYYTNNTSSYLYTNQSYWEMSPEVLNQYKQAWAGCVTANGQQYGTHTNVSLGVRPVINLKSGTTFKSGTDGTWNHPYEVVEN